MALQRDIINKEVVNDTLLYLNEPKLARGFFNKKFRVCRRMVMLLQKTPTPVRVGDNYGNFYDVVLHTPKNENSKNSPPPGYKHN